MTPLESGLAKVAVAGAAILLVLYRSRNIPREQLGFVRPRVTTSLLFLAVYLAWMLGTDSVLHWRGSWNFQPWLAAPFASSALRVLAVCVLGPIAEELIFRGWFFAILKPRAGEAVTVVLTALGWAMLHYSYSWEVILVIFVDGILLGLARRRTGSVLPPIIMHIAYNLYAIW